MPGTHTGELQPHVVGLLLVARLEQVCLAHKEGPGTPCSQGEGTRGLLRSVDLCLVGTRCHVPWSGNYLLSEKRQWWWVRGLARCFLELVLPRCWLQVHGVEGPSP